MDRKRTKPRLITGKRLQTPVQPEERDVQMILQSMRVPELLTRIPPGRRPDLKVKFKEDIEKYFYEPDWMWMPANVHQVTWEKLKPGRYFLLELFRQRAYALIKKKGRKRLVKLPDYMDLRCQTWRAGSYIEKPSE